jgi:voltage-gated sodium channel
MRHTLRAWLSATSTQVTIAVLIIFNTGIIALEYIPSVYTTYEPLLNHLNLIYTVLFTIEVGARLYAYGRDFFQSGWDILDLSILTALVAPILPIGFAITALRSVRLIRIMNNLRELQSRQKRAGRTAPN